MVYKSNNSALLLESESLLKDFHRQHNSKITFLFIAIQLKKRSPLKMKAGVICYPHVFLNLELELAVLAQNDDISSLHSLELETNRQPKLEPLVYIEQWLSHEPNNGASTTIGFVTIINQNFIRFVLGDDDSMIMLRIIGLANGLQFKIIAKSREKIPHIDTLLASGCQLAEGYSKTKAMPHNNSHEWTLCYSCLALDSIVDN